MLSFGPIPNINAKQDNSICIFYIFLIISIQHYNFYQLKGYKSLMSWTNKVILISDFPSRRDKNISYIYTVYIYIRIQYFSNLIQMYLCSNMDYQKKKIPSSFKEAVHLVDQSSSWREYEELKMESMNCDASQEY